jgi:hypothetical protein
MTQRRIITLTCLTGAERIDTDPFAVDSTGQQLMCDAWARQRNLVVHEQLILSGAASGVRILWEHDDRPLLFLTPSRRILNIVLSDPEKFTRRCAAHGAVVAYADLPEPSYTRDMKGILHRELTLPTQGSPTLWPAGSVYPAA